MCGIVFSWWICALIGGTALLFGFRVGKWYGYRQALYEDTDRDP
jgi:hypothetical protein